MDAAEGWKVWAASDPVGYQAQVGRVLALPNATIREAFLANEVRRLREQMTRAQTEGNQHGGDGT